MTSNGGGRSPLWVAIVALFVAFAVAAPIKIAVKQLGDDGGSAGPDDEPVVRMAGLQFSPETLTVRPRTEVVFDNDDVSPHTVTADDGGVDSGTLNPGRTFTLVVDERLAYHCEIHPQMQATVEILA